MRAERIVKALLEADAGVTALVSTRIWAEQAPQAPVLPMLVFSAISATRVPPLHAEPGFGLVQARIAVACHAADVPGVKALAEAVRLALHLKSGSIAGFTCVGVQLDLAGPHLFDDALLAPYQPLDFLITHYE